MTLLTLIIFIAFTLAFFGLGQMIYQRYLSLEETFQIPSQEQKKHRTSSLVFRAKGNRKVTAVILAILGGAAGLNLGIGALGVMAGAIGGGLVPLLLLNAREKKRFRKLEDQLVPTLTMISNGMRSGKTLPQSIDDVSNVAPKPMAGELAITARQMKVGIQPATALMNLQERIPTSDVKLAIRAMHVSITTGSDLPEAIARINETITERNKVEGKIRTLTAQGKMQGIIMSLAPFVLLGAFYAMSPDYMKPMFETTPGNLILIAITVLQVIAYFTIRKIVSIKV